MMTLLSALFLGAAVLMILFLLLPGRRSWSLALLVAAVAALEFCDLQALRHAADVVGAAGGGGGFGGVAKGFGVAAGGGAGSGFGSGGIGRVAGGFPVAPGMVWKYGALLVESLLPLVMTIFSLDYCRPGSFWRGGRVGPLMVAAALFFPAAVVRGDFDAFLFSPDFAAERVVFLGRWGFVFYCGIMIFLALALVRLERTLARLTARERWTVKFEALGAALFPAALVIYYSQAFLYRSLDCRLLPVRTAAFALGLGLMAFGRRRLPGSRPVAVSRTAAFGSFVVILFSLYLFALGMFGEGLRYLGADRARNLGLAAAVMVGVGLVVILLSDAMRRRINVFFHKHFFRDKYDYRNQWLSFTGRVTGSVGEVRQAVLDCFAETFGCGGVALYQRAGEHDGGGFVCTARQGSARDAGFVPADAPLIRRLTERGEWILNLDEEAAGDDGVSGAGAGNPATGIVQGTADVSGVAGVLAADAGNPAAGVVQGGAGAEFARLRALKARLVVPLGRAGEPLEGFILLGERLHAGEELDYEDYDLMRVLARQTAVLLGGFRLAGELAAARELAAVGRVAAFVLHDLKNQASGLALLTENAREYYDDPEFREDLFATLEGSVERIQGLIGRLRGLREAPALTLAPGDLRAVAEGVLAGIGRDIPLSGPPVTANIDRGEIAGVLLNLVLNAVEASDGKVDGIAVAVGAEAGRPFVRVSDRGVGMTPEFIAVKLFQPFSSTKKQGLGIGLYQCRRIVEAHGGRIEVDSEPGRGTVFTVRLPAALSP
ncbi:MAG: PEP-CTERM system histidine kinase PrsK [Deltaproteobacteria bacterium]|nr:PEP-CTERM system histidine kinase PrsK [Candidatus Anaeroferrophillacea bacterium]